MKSLRYFLFVVLSLQSYQAWSYAEACQLVAQMAGNQEYQQKPGRIAVMAAPETLPTAWKLNLLEKHGGWFIYQTPEPWFGKKSCAPVVKQVSGRSLQFMPVLLNKLSGHNAVITGTFIIKVYRKRNLDEVMQRYGFRMLSTLPNPKSLIVDSKPTESYDVLIKQLDLDRDVILALPLLSEPRGRR